MNKANLELYLVTDRGLGCRPLEEIVHDALTGGVTLVQLREKTCPTGEFIEIAESIHTICRAFQVPLIINDRIDVALAINAEGVHLGQSDMPCYAARAILGTDKIIGLSVESVQDAHDAEEDDVDYLAVSPIFYTPTKTDLKRALGLDGLVQIKSFSRHPLVAIGGLNAANAEQVIRAGADGIAVVSAICASENPEIAAAQLRQTVQQAKLGKPS
jgi:thiamine-phosphate pyrophosphorylase